MSKPKVSIIIVNWNNLSDTVECLDSLRQISYPNYEIVLVDNGSDGDDTKQLKNSFSDYIWLIENDKNYGFAEGCNIGIRDAMKRGTDYVLLLNNDTIVAIDFLDELVRVVIDDKGIGIAGGKIYCYEFPTLIWSAGGKINKLTGRTPILGSGRVDCGQFDKITEVGWICGCFMLISCDLIREIGMLDNRFFFGWEDVDLCVRASKLGFKIIFIPTSKIWHKSVKPEKKERLSGRPVYYAARGQLIFIEKHFSKIRLISASLYQIIMMPFMILKYSMTLGQWKVIIYIMGGFWDYWRVKVKKKICNRSFSFPVR